MKLFIGPFFRGVNNEQFLAKVYLRTAFRCLLVAVITRGFAPLLLLPTFRHCGLFLMVVSKGVIEAAHRALEVNSGPFLNMYSFLLVMLYYRARKGVRI